MKLTQADKKFIKLISEGQITQREAFLQSYPEHPRVLRNQEIIRTSKDPHEVHLAHKSITNLAAEKARADFIKRALFIFNKKMDELADESLNVLEDILINGRSEKVRSDIAIELIRHKVGTPTQRIKHQDDQKIVISVGTPPVIEATAEEAEVIKPLVEENQSLSQENQSLSDTPSESA